MAGLDLNCDYASLGIFPQASDMPKSLPQDALPHFSLDKL